MPRHTSIFAEGAAIVPDFITPVEETRILQRIHEAPWLVDLTLLDYGATGVIQLNRWAEIVAANDRAPLRRLGCARSRRIPVPCNRSRAGRTSSGATRLRQLPPRARGGLPETPDHAKASAFHPSRLVVTAGKRAPRFARESLAPVDGRGAMGSVIRGRTGWPGRNRTGGMCRALEPPRTRRRSPSGIGNRRTR